MGNFVSVAVSHASSFARNRRTHSSGTDINLSGSPPTMSAAVTLTHLALAVLVLCRIHARSNLAAVHPVVFNRPPPPHQRQQSAIFQVIEQSDPSMAHRRDQRLVTFEIIGVRVVPALSDFRESHTRFPGTGYWPSGTTRYASDKSRWDDRSETFA